MNTSTRVTGRSLRLARLLWLAVALFYGFLLAASTPANFSAENAARTGTDLFRGWSPAQISQAFADLRLTPRAFTRSLCAPQAGTMTIVTAH